MIDAVCVQGKKVDLDMARRIAAGFETEVINTLPEDKTARYFLIDKTGIAFVAGELFLKGDFMNMLKRVEGGHLQHEIVLKAANQDADKNPGVLRAVDATAGLGEDSFILAAGGYSVEMFEHNPVTAVLLKDALTRAKNDSRLKAIASRMSLKQGDSKELLAGLSYTPDLIYLDPMYPDKKKNAESKKKLQVLHKIEAPCADENELMAAAMAVKPAKILIKRPPDGPHLAGVKPTYSVERKAVRYDCIVF